MMKYSLMAVGIIVGILGVLCYWSIEKWTICWGFISIPSPLAFLSPLNPYSWYILIIGIIIFFVGLFKKGGD